jgi:hypothetical protein
LTSAGCGLAVRAIKRHNEWPPLQNACHCQASWALPRGLWLGRRPWSRTHICCTAHVPNATAYSLVVEFGKLQAYEPLVGLEQLSGKPCLVQLSTTMHSYFWWENEKRLSNTRTPEAAQSWVNCPKTSLRNPGTKKIRNKYTAIQEAEQWREKNKNQQETSCIGSISTVPNQFIDT